MATPTDPVAPLLDEELTASYEELARDHPSRYRLTLAGLALLGYAYIVFVLLALVGFGLLLLRLHNLQALVGAAGVLFAAVQIVRALWVRRVEAAGLDLAEHDAPALFATVDRLRSALGCRAPRRVLLTVDCNASVDATRWGRRAGPLTIGLPLLLALSPEEAEAVLAHELGHVSRVHGAFNLWIYRVHGTWARLAQFLGQRGLVAFLLGRFARWYFPRFAACAQVLSRGFERHADREAARLTHPAALASALARIQVTDGWMDASFWPEVSQRARAEEQALSGVFDRLAEALARPDPERERLLERALALRTMYWDTHPSLADRVAALGVAAPVLTPVTVSAAVALLGAQLPRLMRETERAWLEGIGAAWHEHRAELGRAEERLRALSSSTASEDPEEAWQRASLTEQVHGPAAAEPLYRLLLASAPQHHRARYALGRILLQRREPEGEALVTAVLDDAWLAPHAYALLFGHLAGEGRHDEADRMHRRAAAHQELLEEAGAERSSLTTTDELTPHGLTAAELERLVAQLAGRAGPSEIYLVRKRVRIFPEKPCFVLGVVMHVAWYRPVGPGFGQKILDAIASEVEFREPLLVVGLTDERALRNKVLVVEGALIFSGDRER
jgi:Zn-dependent protease with chaperone function